MQLTLRDYLQSLKERNELDSLVQDLLFSMGFEITAKPQRGLKEKGVDIEAIGKDPEDGKKKVFLLTVKPGDLIRSNWKTGPQSVSESIDDILRIYIPQNLSVEFKKLPKKVILCCGGEVHRSMKDTWDGYVNEKAYIYENIAIEFWGAERLTGYILKFLISEDLFPEKMRTLLRKSIVLVADNDYDNRHFYKILRETLFQDSQITKNSEGIRRLRLLRTALKVLFYWGKTEKNLSNVTETSERFLLNAWNWAQVRKIRLYSSRSVKEELDNIYRLYEEIHYEYFSRLKNHFSIREGLYAGQANPVTSITNLFKIIGQLSAFGLAHRFFGLSGESELEIARTELVDWLKQIILNHNGSKTPAFDEHSIDLGLSFLFLYQENQLHFLKSWIAALIDSLQFFFIAKRYFPISSNDISDLIELFNSVTDWTVRHRAFSTIVPLLADWCVVLDMKSEYKKLHDLKGEFESTDLQCWYPSNDCEKTFFTKNSLREGIVWMSIFFPPNMKEHIKNIKKIHSSIGHIDKYYTHQQGYVELLLIASRHFRTPIPPYYWQNLL